MNKAQGWPSGLGNELIIRARQVQLLHPGLSIIPYLERIITLLFKFATSCCIVIFSVQDKNSTESLQSVMEKGFHEK